MTQRAWVSLHNHTIYSIKDAIATPHEYAKKLHEWNNKHGEYFLGFICSEHGYFNSIVKSYNAFNDKNLNNGKTIKALYGVEMYHSIGDTKDADKKERYHIPLIAKTQEGLSNLYEIASYGGLNAVVTSVKTYPRADIENLKEFGKGIIALSGCVGGYIPQLLLNGEYKKAKEVALFFKEIFDDFYLEIQPMEFALQNIVNQDLMKLSKDTNIGLVITCDSHYVDKEDRTAHNVLFKMSYGNRKKDETNDKEQDSSSSGLTDYAHFRTPDEIQKYCIDNNIPLEAMDNTVKIYNECNVDLKPKDEKGLMPSFKKIPKGYTDDSYLEKLAFIGLFERIHEQFHIDVKNRVDRMRHELDVVKLQGFSSYFLILWAWIKFCRKRSILIGPGRGSAAGSVLAYSLRITNCDPIRHDLMFERFLNPERKEFPDIDTDIETAKRSEGIEYFIDEYGEEYVCQIITYSHYKIKSLIKAIVSAYYSESENYSEIVKEINIFTKTIPMTIGGKEVTYNLIEDAFENPNNYDISDKEYIKVQKLKTDLDLLMEKYPEIKHGIIKLKNVISSTGAHAGGVVISSKKLRCNVPLIKPTGAAVLPIIQLEMNDLDFFGLLKLDCLGLNSLSQIHDALDLIGLPLSWLDEEDYSDKNVYEFLRKGFTNNIFQMSSYSATNMIKNFKVNDIEGLIAVNACNRPGPLTKLDELDGKSIVEIYSDVADGKREAESFNENIDPIFENTNGCLIYQEQCMKLGQVMCGYSLGNSDLRIRKTIGKKKIDKIPEIKNEFIYGKKSVFNEDGKVVGISKEDSNYCTGAIPLGYSEALALKLFAIMESMAKYAFNKSHSAAYGTLAYKTAYLSFNYPVEYTIGCLNHIKDSDKIQETLDACKKRDVKVLPPDINTSMSSYTLVIENDEKVIRYGLSKIKDIGDVAVNEIIQVRKLHGKFTSFDDFYFAINNDEYKKQFIEPKVTVKEKKKKVNGVSQVIKETHYSYPIKTNKRVISALILAGAFDELEPNRHKLHNHYMFDIRKENKIVIKKDKESGKSLEVDQELDEKLYKKRTKFKYELEYLSAYISGHPLDGLPYTDLSLCEDGQKVKVTGIVKFKDKAKVARNKKKYSSISIETKDNKIVRIQFFGNAYEEYFSKIKKDKVLVFEGIYSNKYNNISCNKMLELKPKQKEEISTIFNIPNDEPDIDDSEIDEIPSETIEQAPLYGSLDLEEIYG